MFCVHVCTVVYVNVLQILDADVTLRPTRDKKCATAAHKMLMSTCVGAACATWHTGKSADMNALETLRNTQYCTGHVEIGEV